MVDAQIDGAADQILRLGVVGIAVDARQAHAAETDRGDGEALRAELAMRDLFHLCCHPCCGSVIAAEDATPRT